MIFGHSGDLGDIIYSLPTIRALGGGRLVLFDMPGRSAHGMTPGKMERIKPLLLLQDYIHAVEWSDYPVNTNINGFRDHMIHGNLADAHLATHGLEWHHRNVPWLKVDEPRHEYDVVIHRSERYHNANFPWGDALKKYKGRIGYVGFEAEHKAFCKVFGEVPRIEASDFLQLARVIHGAKLFIGNQSSPLAISHGMHKTLVMEISPGGAQQHCVFQRLNCITGWDRKIIWPELELLGLQ